MIAIGVTNRSVATNRSIKLKLAKWLSYRFIIYVLIFDAIFSCKFRNGLKFGNGVCAYMPDMSLACEPKCSCAPGYAREHAEGGMCIEQTQCPEPAPECPKVKTLADVILMTCISSRQSLTMNFRANILLNANTVRRRHAIKLIGVLVSFG